MGTAPKKFDPTRVAPNRNLLIAGIVMILLGLVWGLYEWNPGLMLRQETAAETKERKDNEQAEKEKALKALKKRR